MKNPIYKDENCSYVIPSSVYRKTPDGIFIPAFSAGKDKTEETLPAFYPKNKIANFDELLDPQTIVRNIIATGDINFNDIKFLFPDLTFGRLEKSFNTNETNRKLGFIDYEQYSRQRKQALEAILNRII